MCVLFTSLVCPVGIQICISSSSVVVASGRNCEAVEFVRPQPDCSFARAKDINEPCSISAVVKSLSRTGYLYIE